MYQSIPELIEQVRGYLRHHPKTQAELTREIVVSSAWLNRFVLGKINSMTTRRLEALRRWMEKDREERIAQSTPKTPQQPENVP